MPALTVIDFPDEPEAFDIEADAGFVSADAGGDTFTNDGKTMLYAKNTSGAGRTITVAAARQCSHGFSHNAAISVPDGFAGFVATDFENDRFSDAAGVVSMTYDNNVGLEVAAVRRPA